MGALIEPGSGIPAYRRVADGIIRDILSGRLSPGSRLSTVRELARETGLSQGTAMHVYDVLENEGYLIKTQGRGTFVRERESAPGGYKEQAMESIDRLLDDMRAMGFGWREIRIFLDLKLRQREEEGGAVRIGAVECSPEALAMMREQILTLPRVEVDAYPLATVLESPRAFEPVADLVVTTTTHGHELTAKLKPGQAPVQLVMALDAETAVTLASISPRARVCVVCKSERFSQLIRAGCEKYCRLTHPVRAAYFGDGKSVEAAVGESDVVILAPNYHQFATAEEAAAIRGHRGETILYRYQIEKGSLVYLENQVKALQTDG